MTAPVCNWDGHQYDPAGVLSEEERLEIAFEIRDDRTRDAAGVE